MSTETPVSTTPVKVSRGNRFRPFVSDKDTQPLGDVYRDGKLIEGLTEEQKVAEGINPPLAWKPIEFKDGRAVGRFEKTEKERELLKEVHDSAKGPTGIGGNRGSRKHLFRKTLIVHRLNVHHKKDFKTTLTFSVFPNEVDGIIRSLHDKERNRVVVKYHYAGESVTIG